MKTRGRVRGQACLILEGSGPIAEKKGKVREGVPTRFLADRLSQVRVIREAGAHLEPKHP